MGMATKTPKPPPPPGPGPDFTDEVIQAVAEAERRKSRIGRTRTSTFGQTTTLMGG